MCNCIRKYCIYVCVESVNFYAVVKNTYDVSVQNLAHSDYCEGQPYYHLIDITKKNNMF